MTQISRWPCTCASTSLRRPLQTGASETVQPTHEDTQLYATLHYITLHHITLQSSPVLVLVL